MAKWMSGAFLFLACVGGIGYVLQDRQGRPHCGPCVDKPLPTAATEPSGSCPMCDSGKPSKVYDVADFNRYYNTPEPKNQISFEEPPLAKPRGEVTPVKYETPALDVAPMPRLVTE